MAFARLSRFMEQIRQMAQEGMFIEEKALHGSRDFIRFVFSFIVLLKNSG